MTILGLTLTAIGMAVLVGALLIWWLGRERSYTYVAGVTVAPLRLRGAAKSTAPRRRHRRAPIAAAEPASVVAPPLGCIDSDAAVDSASPMSSETVSSIVSPPEATPTVAEQVPSSTNGEIQRSDAQEAADAQAVQPSSAVPEEEGQLELEASHAQESLQDQEDGQSRATSAEHARRRGIGSWVRGAAEKMAFWRRSKNDAKALLVASLGDDPDQPVRVVAPLVAAEPEGPPAQPEWLSRIGVNEALSLHDRVAYFRLFFGLYSGEEREKFFADVEASDPPLRGVVIAVRDLPQPYVVREAQPPMATKDITP